MHRSIFFRMGAAFVTVTFVGLIPLGRVLFLDNVRLL